MQLVMHQVISNIPLTQSYIKTQTDYGSTYIAAPYQFDIPQIISLPVPNITHITVDNLSLVSGTGYMDGSHAFIPLNVKSGHQIYSATATMTVLNGMVTNVSNLILVTSNNAAADTTTIFNIDNTSTPNIGSTGSGFSIGIKSVVSDLKVLVINTMVPIIDNGVLTGTTTPPPRIPIALYPSSDANYQRTYEILKANKNYIIAEVIGFMNSLKSPKTTKIYTAPPGVTAIVLMAQVSNVSDHYIEMTFAHYRNLPVYQDPSTLNGYQAPDVVTEIVKNYGIPPNDSASLIQGKMIIESFDSIVAYASESSSLKVTLSILETANA